MASLDASLVEKAVSALLDFTRKNQKKSTLIEDSPKYILVQIQLLKPIEKSVLKPARILIPHSLFSVEHDHSACLFVKSNELQTIESYFVENPSTYITKIISMDQVVKLYKALKDKKQLLSQHTHFLCDERIMTQLYNALGKVFGNRHNYPVPIDISNTGKIAATVEKALNASYCHMSGSNISIRLGHTGMSKDDIVANVLEGFQSAITKLGTGNATKGFAKIHSLHMKTSTSAALPIYSKVSSEVMQYVKALSDGTVVYNEQEEKVEEEQAEKKAAKASKVAKKDGKTVGKEKKRALAEVSDGPVVAATKVKKSKTSKASS